MSTNTILVATDGTDHARLAVTQAAELAKKTGAELTVAVINVVHGGGRGPIVYDLTDDEAEKIAHAAAEDAKRAGVAKVEEVVLTGREAASAIVGLADEKHCDVIVTGTGDKRGISRLVLGSVAADVARRAHCSVMVAR